MATARNAAAEMLQLLRSSVDDGRLSQHERNDLARRLGAVAGDDEMLRRTRNMAFDLARERLEGGDDAMSLLRWLEKIVRTLDNARPAPPRTRTEAWFSPGKDCLEGVIGLFGRASKNVRVCVFTIADDRITEAILSAHRRGVAIRILTDDDKRFDAGSDVERLGRAGIEVVVDRSPAHMHHKFAIFDDRVLLNGSFNWTRSASRYNEENLLLTDDAVAVGPFIERFESLWRRFAH